ncbi:MAG: hypothetical protein M1818_002871 [Claussenomyces sp. TS43310]|nr:MAG: hypothetical protein M1818_002871 [Claussenomyces sp. TS43310]
MVALAPILRKAYLSITVVVAIYGLALLAFVHPWIQRHVLYAHKVQTWWYDLNKPEQWGFAKNQITPFNLTTPDNETLYAWHVMPLELYAKHEVEILQQPSGCAEDITKTKAFRLLQDDPNARLIVNFHGNAGTVAQGWRTDSYRSYSDSSTSNIHILAVDYRGYGYSSGSPTEAGLILDGIATVNWALNIAKVPSDRIVILGQSIGTAVTTGVIEHFAEQGTEFAAVILIAGFTDLPNLLTQYAIGGWIPILSPLNRAPTLRRWLHGRLVDTWPSATRLANFVRKSKKVRLFLIHAKDDFEIPWTHSEGLFVAAANATSTEGIDLDLIRAMKARNTVEMGDGAFVSTWNAGGDKVIREQIVLNGREYFCTNTPSVAKFFSGRT